MVTVAVVAGRSARVALLRHRPGVHALAPQFELIVAKRAIVIGAPSHHLLVGVACGARIRDARGVNGRFQIVDRPDIVVTVAGNTGGDLLVAVLFEPLPVATCPILRHLIDPW